MNRRTVRAFAHTLPSLLVWPSPRRLLPAMQRWLPTLNVSPAMPIRGETAVVSAAFGSGVVRPVRLQRLAKGAWVRVASARTSSAGIARFSYRTGTSRVTLRVLAPRFRAKGHTYAQRISRLRTITPAAQSISLTVSRDITGRVDAQSVASQPAHGAHGVPADPGRGWRLAHRRVAAHDHLTRAAVRRRDDRRSGLGPAHARLPAPLPWRSRGRLPDARAAAGHDEQHAAGRRRRALGHHHRCRPEGEVLRRRHDDCGRHERALADDLETRVRGATTSWRVPSVPWRASPARLR